MSLRGRLHPTMAAILAVLMAGLILAVGCSSEGDDDRVPSREPTAFPTDADPRATEPTQSPTVADTDVMRLVGDLSGEFDGTSVTRITFTVQLPTRLGDVAGGLSVTFAPADGDRTLLTHSAEASEDGTMVTVDIDLLETPDVDLGRGSEIQLEVRAPEAGSLVIGRELPNFARAGPFALDE